MSVGDLIMSDCVAIMELMELINGNSGFNITWCIMKLFLRTFSFFQSLLFITMIAVLRTYFGLASHKVKPSKTKIVLAIMLVFSVSGIMGVLWSLPKGTSVQTCLGLEGNFSDHVSKILLNVLMIITMVLFLVSVFCYIILAIAIKCKNNVQAKSHKLEILTTKVGLVVFVIFLICYVCPFLPAIVPKGTLGPAKYRQNRNSLFNTLALLQSAISPVVYILSNSSLKKSFVKSCYMVQCTMNHTASDEETTNASSSMNTSTSVSTLRHITETQYLGVNKHRRILVKEFQGLRNKASTSGNNVTTAIGSFANRTTRRVKDIPSDGDRYQDVLEW